MAINAQKKENITNKLNKQTPKNKKSYVLIYNLACYLNFKFKDQVLPHVHAIESKTSSININQETFNCIKPTVQD